MNISVIGTGYPGVVQAVRMAEIGHHVLGIDTDAARISMLSQGRASCCEPGLDDLLDRNVRSGHRLFLRGRPANVINVAGEKARPEKVRPEKVEVALMAHQAVLDADVYAEADVRRGQIPVAAVTVRVETPVAELVGWCRARLEPYRVPRRIEIRDELPRTATGKRVYLSGHGPRP